VQKFEPPVKVGKYDLLSGLVLDWPRHWRDFCDGFAVEKLQELRAEGFSKYYDSAIDFVQYSEMNAMWFVPELEAQIGPFTVVEGV
jgi:hypothetical protein